MRKRILSALLSAAVIFSCIQPGFAADPDINATGNGGSDMEKVTGTSVWHVGYDGLRISIIDGDTLQVVGTCFDWTNIYPSSKTISFAKRNKLQYIGGANLAPISKGYVAKHTVKIPQIVSPSGASTIAGVKEFFTRKSVLVKLAKDADFNYNTLTDPNNNFAVLLEPIAYFTCNGLDYAMTATEAAMYDRTENGELRHALGNLTHKNMPLSMYLEEYDLGIHPGIVAIGSGYQDNENIIGCLGVGIIRFGDPDNSEEAPAIPDRYDYEYHTDEDVVTSIRVSSGTEINPDDPGRATFEIPGVGTYTKEYVIPEAESQLVWVKWHTPSTPGAMKIPISASHGGASTAYVSVNIVEPEENTPPNPEGRDRNDAFKLKSPPAEGGTNLLKWGEWYAVWHPDWVYNSSKKKWEDHGWWDCAATRC